VVLRVRRLGAPTREEAALSLHSLRRTVPTIFCAALAALVGCVGSAAASPVTALSAGYSYACVGSSAGGAECWGLNFYGELGNGTINEDWSPTRYPVPLLEGVSALAASPANGEDHTCAVVTGGAVKCWGANFNGDLGDGTTTYRKAPVGVGGVSGATSVAVGFFHSCALISGGTIKCWGADGWGQLGDGTLVTERLSPVSVAGITDATSIGAEEDATCATRSNGELDCWGRNLLGALGPLASPTVPTAFPGISDAIGIAVGFTHSCALIGDGTVRCWGEAGEGQVGDLDYPFEDETPVTVAAISDAVQVVVGWDHSCALLSGGQVACWGSNLTGQLGVQNVFKSASPIVIPGIGEVVRIAAGSNFTCALKSSGEAFCWGGEFGALPTVGGGGSGGGSTGGGSGGAITGGGSSGSNGSPATPPVVHITEHPPKETADQTAEFEFSGMAGGSYECSIDAGTWKLCESGDSFPPLQPGDHRFEVRESLNGLTGPAASYSWTIDLPRACILKVARARVFAFTHQDRARLVIHYKAYEPAQVSVSYSSAGANGSLALGTASARFKTAGVYRLTKKLGDAATAKLKAASSMKVHFAVPQAPASCARYYTKQLTIPKKIFGQTTWFQSDSIFGRGAK
jgi:alpha-tubulin suppressor-like RCC1 family protein